ncbi:hypothetical protein J1605_004305 [Eschrichtius robustus]|uniref:Uncharacterized protein n=1 Tax=Eschrichtius robustus TaxID=9764 RepID=A0AB34HGE8_ESCRO|nr:hypothetical protein J1605_004305 [Eschrichtius robustus]
MAVSLLSDRCCDISRVSGILVGGCGTPLVRGPARDAVVCLAGGRHAVPGPAPAVQVTEEKQLSSGPGLPASNVGQPRAQKDGATCWRLHCGQEGNPGLNHVRRPQAAFGCGFPFDVRFWLRAGAGSTSCKQEISKIHHTRRSEAQLNLLSGYLSDEQNTLQNLRTFLSRKEKLIQNQRIRQGP